MFSARRFSRASRELVELAVWATFTRILPQAPQGGEISPDFVLVVADQLVGLDQVEDAQVEIMENRVGHVQGQEAFPFQYVMKMGLAQSGEAGETAFSDFPALYTAAEVFEKALMKAEEGHIVRYRDIPL